LDLGIGWTIKRRNDKRKHATGDDFLLMRVHF
jgi:hypothetical protein